MKKKKIITVCLVVALVAVFAIGGSLAYFTDEDTKDNTFTVGNVDIVLDEPNWDGPIEDAYPGQVLAKDPNVTNNGDNPCYVRIKVTGLDCLQPAGNITYRVKDGEAGSLGSNWVLGDDGYFYYTEILEPEATTTNLFDEVIIPTSVTNGYDGNYDIVVKAEAIQSQGFESYTDAFAAFDAE